MNRTLLFVLAFAVAVAEARGDEPKGTKAGGRVVEGKIVSVGNKPVEGATVLFSKIQNTLALVEGVTATTDAQGRFRTDLVNFPWSTGTIQAVVLSPGYKAVERKFEAGTGIATANFEMSAERWKETQIRMEDSSGRPVAGESIICSVGGVIWSRFKTDALGCCRIAMPPHMPMRLSSEPKDARPIEAFLGGEQDDPTPITMPFLPPIRGRVLDPVGRPVPNAAVGRWLTFEPDGTGEMLAFPGGSLAVTDRDGNFKIAPALHLRLYMSRPAPKLECSASPNPATAR